MRAWPFLLGLTVIAPVAIAHADDCANAPDQASMNECMTKSYKKADEELNALYERIAGRLKGGSDTAKARAALVAAQRAWIAFRDAEYAFVGFPTAQASIHTTIVASCLTDLTNRS
jgi:uncharacterized protein YecT (DUF1311 family)